MIKRNNIYNGDVLETLRTFPEGIFNTCVTSPPYWGLRDYGVEGQIGLESTPDEYVEKMVEVFREVRRVLRDDGTLWLNLGDSYAANKYAGNKKFGNPAFNKNRPSREQTKTPKKTIPNGLKPKDLVGIPWSVAKELQKKYYAGRIKKEQDRVWLAAMIDGEGTICGFEHQRKDDGRVRTGVHLFITNASTSLLEEAMRIYPASNYAHSVAGKGHLGSRDVFRWTVTGAENKSNLIAEIYPYIIAKKKQALLAWILLEFIKDGRRLGKSVQAQSVRDKRSLLVALMSNLNKGVDVDIPSWCVEPPSLYEDGWYLRSDIIWEKPNCLPESVKDRPTKAHEYIFLLSKSPKYYYDADAIKEPLSASVRSRADYVPKDGKRNKRTVWSVSTRPFKGAHFAVFPPDLIEPCILAGSPEGGLVLDPFFGSGTTGLVARQNGRDFVGIELNPEYIEIARERLGIWNIN